MLSSLVVIGTGFMGASIAAAAKARGLAASVIGVDPKEASQAKAQGMIDRAEASIESALGAAGAAAVGAAGSNAPLPIGILIAAPVTAYDVIFAELEEIAALKGLANQIAWVSDIGSTKHGVMQAARKHFNLLAPRFVSSHPMAGSEKNGAAHANPDVLIGARVLISPMPAATGSVATAASAAPNSGSSQDAMGQLESFWLALGAIPNPLPIDDHDALLAAISHLPHVLAYSLAASLAQSPLAAASQALHGGGLRDTTRIAASNPELWADIFLDNRDGLLEVWSEWALELDGMRKALENGDRALLMDMLHRASQWRKGFSS